MNTNGRSGWRVALAGGGVEEVTLLELQERIRTHDVDGATEVCPPGSDVWIRASQAPALAPWLRSSGETPAVPARPAAPPGPVEPLVSRAISGALYPFIGTGGLVLGALALVSVVPFLSLVVGPAMSVWILAIIRESAKGSRSMPMDVPSDMEELLEVWFKTALVSLVTLLPVVAVAAWGVQTRGPAFAADASFRLWLALAGAVTLLYYPASLATVAVWDRALPALDPSHVVRVIRTIGRDYFVAVGLGAAVVLAGFFAANFATSSLRFLPVVGRLVGFLISTAAMFWAAHVLGWAVHRHAAALGWD